MSHKSRQLKASNIGVCAIGIVQTEYWQILANAIAQVIAIFLYTVINLPTPTLLQS